MATNITPISVGSDAFAITVSDTVDIVDDAANTKSYRSCYVHNAHTAQGLVKVTTVGNKDVTVMINSGDTFPLAVKRVWSTGTDASVAAAAIAIVGTDR